MSTVGEDFEDVTRVLYAVAIGGTAVCWYAFSRLT